MIAITFNELKFMIDFVPEASRVSSRDLQPWSFSWQYDDCDRARGKEHRGQIAPKCGYSKPGCDQDK